VETNTALDTPSQRQLFLQRIRVTPRSPPQRVRVTAAVRCPISSPLLHGGVDLRLLHGAAWRGRDEELHVRKRSVPFCLARIVAEKGPTPGCYALTQYKPLDLE
jgi:hypothetical protein